MKASMFISPLADYIPVPSPGLAFRIGRKSRKNLLAVRGRRHPPMWTLGLCLLTLGACGGPGTAAASGGARLRIIQPGEGQVVTVRSLSLRAEVSGLDRFRLHYFLDGADQGLGDTSITI